MGLQRAPFLSHIDNTFYYAYPSFAQRLQMLTHLIKGSDFLVLVIGEQDSGKTTLLNQFLASTDNKWRGCKIRAYSKTKSNNAPLFENLDNHPAFILSDENLPIVMLDDAHKLTDIELQFLLQEALAPGSMDKLKRLVLFCEPSIQAVMAALTTPIAEETVKIGAKVFWLQYGIQNDEAKKIVESKNIAYISNKCIKQEYQRLFLKISPVFPALKN